MPCSQSSQQINQPKMAYFHQYHFDLIPRQEISRQFIESYSDDQSLTLTPQKYEIEDKFQYKLGIKSDNLLSFSINCNFTEQQNYKNGVDLLFLIDVSQQVSDENLEQIKNSLCTLTRCLTEQDRFSIILYTQLATRLFPFLTMDQNNKQKVLDLIRGITIFKGGANIASGMTMAYLCLLNRKYINQRTCLISLCSSDDVRRGNSILKQIIDKAPYIKYKAYCNEKPKKNCYQKVVFIEKIETLNKLLCNDVAKLQQTVLKDLKIVIKSKNEFLLTEMFGGKYQFINQNEFHIKKQFLSIGHSKHHIIGIFPQNYNTEICQINVFYTTLNNETNKFQIPISFDQDIDQSVLIQKYKYKSKMELIEAIEYYDPYRIQDSKAVLQEYLNEINQLDDNLKQSLKDEINKIEYAMQQLKINPNTPILNSFQKEQLRIKTQLSQQYIKQFI